MKSAQELPFLEEKLRFRRRIPVEQGDRILCAYGGREGRLTSDYAERGAVVTAVDLNPNYSIDVQWIAGEIPGALPDTGDFTVVDFDPDGSPMPVLAEWFDTFRGSFRWLVLTDGGMTIARFQRKINLKKYYGILPDAIMKMPPWCWRQFECLVFHRIASLIDRSIVSVRFERNRYQMALYAAFEFQD